MLSSFCQTNAASNFLIKGLVTEDELTEERGEPVKDLKIILLGDRNPEHTIQISSILDEATKWQLVNFL